MSIRSFFKNLGPGPLIAAAFIGPGTVTVCTLAGANFGFSLLWALVLSILATVILQELSGRIGIVTGQDLSSLLRNQSKHKVLKYLSIGLVLVAILLGNAAYESGNISGANLGLAFYWEAPTLQFGSIHIQTGNFLLGILAFGLLWIGSYHSLERALVGLVLLMSLAFMVTAVLTKPDWSTVLKGLIPRINDAEIPTLVALIGTTVVPYNLFLYAALVKKRWKKTSELPYMKRDIAVSVILGGTVSMAILVVGAANTSSEISSAIDVSRGLETVFGSFAGYMMGFGLLAAGLTSTLTAPLAAGLVVCGIMGWNQEIRSTSMRITMGIIVGLGLIFSSFGIKPIQLIILAQLANGILLPLISGWIIWIAAQKSVLGSFSNTPFKTGIASLIWLITLILGIKSIITVFGFEL